MRMRYILLMSLIFSSTYAQLEVPGWISIPSGVDSTQFLAEPMPDIPYPQYSPQMWDPGGDGIVGQFQTQKTWVGSFKLTWTARKSEPYPGYPYHYGNVVGLNDTIKLVVRFVNSSQSDYPIDTASPEIWIVPQLYDPYADALTSSPLADTSVFSYRFEHWLNLRSNRIVAKPDTIYSDQLHKWRAPQMAMVFSLWGISPGYFRVVAKPSQYTPTGVAIIFTETENVFRIVNGSFLADTLNAYCKGAGDALVRNEYTIADAFIDSVFYFNPNSIPGWALRFHLHANQYDTTNAVAAIDSMLNVINNRLDPVVPDSSQLTEYYQYWLEDYENIHEFRRWRMRNPNVSKWIKQWR